MNSLWDVLRQGKLWFTVVSVLVVSPQVLVAENILLILADDIGTESLTSYAGDFQTPTVAIRPLTPNLSRLANTSGRSIRFTNCWATPVCSPTRACVLTGKHGFRTGVYWGDPFMGPQYSVAQAFQQAGYETAAFGKWHLNPKAPGEIGNPIVLGFDQFIGSTINCCFDTKNQTYFNWTKRIESAGSFQTVRVNKYAPLEFVDSAAAWINQNNQDNKPWFAYVALHMVHAPWHLPPLDLHSYPNAVTSVEKYEAMIQAMDSVIGRLLDSIDLRNTTVIFVGDNGNPATVSPFWGVRGKRSTYQGGVHVPCIVYRGGLRRSLIRRTTNDALIHVVDLFDTMIELTGNDPDLLTPVGAASDSRSFARYITRPRSPIMEEHKFNYTEMGRMGASSFRTAIRDEHYKLIQPGDDQPEEFYDLLSDPFELVDLMPSLTTKQMAVVNDLRVKRQAIWDSDD